MNKIELVTKLISIHDPLMGGLAKLALFGEIQKAFNLHPGKLAEDFMAQAKKERKSPGAGVKEIAEHLMPLALETFEWKLNEAQTLFKPHCEMADPTRPFPLTRYFNLEPEKVAKLIRNRIEQAGMDPMEIVDKRWTQAEFVLIVLRGWMREIIPWAFQEAVRIAEQSELA